MKNVKKILSTVLCLSLFTGFSASIASFAMEDFSDYTLEDGDRYVAEEIFGDNLPDVIPEEIRSVKPASENFGLGFFKIGKLIYFCDLHVSHCSILAIFPLTSNQNNSFTELKIPDYIMDLPVEMISDGRYGASALSLEEKFPNLKVIYLPATVNPTSVPLLKRNNTNIEIKSAEDRTSSFWSCTIM